MALTRREFLAGGLSLSLGLSSFAAARGAEKRLTLNSANKAKNKALVIVNLSGGNDAFNTLVPWSSQAYYRARPNLALGQSEIIKLDNELALAAPLGPLVKYFEAGSLAIVPGVGLSSGLSRSHSRALEIWHSAQPDIIGKSGWIGRYLDGASDAVAIDFDPDGEHRLLFAGLAQNTQNLVATAALDRSHPQAYPQTRFGQSLATIARTLNQKAVPKSDLSACGKSSIFSVTLPGFDTHSNQKIRHQNLLGELASSLDAFMANVDESNTSAIVFVQSEFGRRLKENNGNIFNAPDMVPVNVGTDHGSSGLCFILGHGVRGGIYGQYGDLDNLIDGEVAASLDFRTVYATILEGHMQTESRAILGGDFKTLGFV
jgi:uncharacterized protein (DUF1501 family)